MRRCGLLILTLALLTAVAAGESLVVEDFDGSDGGGLRLKESVEGSVVFALDQDESGGRHLALDFERKENAGYAYVYLPITGGLSKSASEYDGISLRVKGDGSATFGLIEIRCDGYTNIFQAVFPLDSKEWRRVEIRWDEFFQINDGTREAGINWNDLNVFALGSRAMWGSCSYAIDDIALASIEPAPARRAYDGMCGLSHTVAKLKEGAQVTLAALGDSITYGTKVPQEKRDSALYFALVAEGLEESFDGVSVKAVNAGRGGDTIAEGLVRIGHQVAACNADLVMVYLGANDAFYDFPEQRVRHTMSLLLDKLLETTDADILLLGPTQIIGKPGVPESYGKIYSEVAREKGVAYLDLSDALAVLAEPDFDMALADNVHLSVYGHEVVGQAILEFILEKARQ